MGGPVGSSSRAVGAIVRRLAPAALVALMAWVLGTPPGLAQTTSPYTIVQETEVTVDVQLILQGPAGARDVTEFELKGVAGKGLPFREALESGGLKVSTSGSIRATPRSDGTGVDLSIDARSALGGDPESRVDRDLDLSAGRTGLADLWNGGPADSYRLVAAVTVSWEVVPKVVPISPAGSRSI